MISNCNVIAFSINDNVILKVLFLTTYKHIPNNKKIENRLLFLNIKIKNEVA